MIRLQSLAYQTLSGGQVSHLKLYICLGAKFFSPEFSVTRSQLRCPTFLGGDADEGWLGLVSKEADHVWREKLASRCQFLVSVAAFCLTGNYLKHIAEAGDQSWATLTQRHTGGFRL